MAVRRFPQKTGLNIESVLSAVVEQIPPPKGNEDDPLRALIFDSYYDPYLGVVVNIRVFDGTVRTGDKIKMMSSGAVFEVTDVGALEPFGLSSTGVIRSGEVGYLTASIKTLSDTSVGDTITLADNPAEKALPGFKKVSPWCFPEFIPRTEPDTKI